MGWVGGARGRILVFFFRLSCYSTYGVVGGARRGILVFLLICIRCALWTHLGPTSCAVGVLYSPEQSRAKSKHFEAENGSMHAHDSAKIYTFNQAKGSSFGGGGGVPKSATWLPGGFISRGQSCCTLGYTGVHWGDEGEGLFVV